MTTTWRSKGTCYPSNWKVVIIDIKMGDNGNAHGDDGGGGGFCLSCAQKAIKKTIVNEVF